MNRWEQMSLSLMWMLEEAECYVGCQVTNDPHEAARRIITYFDEVRYTNPAKYQELMEKARNARDPDGYV